MKNSSDKFHLIYKPFLLIALGFILVYTFLHWLLFIKLGFSLKEDVLKFWLPFGLPYVPVFIWLRPRLKLLQTKNDNGPFYLMLFACLVIALPTMVAQHYLITATGKLSIIDNVSQIEKGERTKYYTFKNYYVDKQHIAVENTATVTGKHNDDLNMHVYIAMPILINQADTTKTHVTTWLGKKYSQTISNNLSDTEKEKKFDQFIENCQKQFDATDFSKFTYLEVLGNTEDHDAFNNAIKKMEPNKAIVFVAQTEPYAARNGNTLPWVFGSLAISFFVYYIILLFPKFNANALKNFKAGKTSQKSDLAETFEFFIPKANFFITPILIDLNLLVFLCMVLTGLGVLSFKGGDLLTWGANFKPLTTNGEWWRLLTSTFLHGGLMHIVANMMGLLFIGIFLEPFLGRTKYALVYLTTGIFASLASIWWYDATISVGASGAIFGLYGFFLACVLLKIFSTEFTGPFITGILIFVGFNLLMGFKGGIDNAAHIGGLISGFILALVMSKQLKQKVEIENEYDPEDEA